jgi:hypothetical protein
MRFLIGFLIGCMAGFAVAGAFAGANPMAMLSGHSRTDG